MPALPLCRLTFTSLLHNFIVIIIFFFNTATLLREGLDVIFALLLEGPGGLIITVGGLSP